MPSSIPGYEYDVFISYRQKDNKYDGWVTEFISNFRKELEATFKEEIFIYSDENDVDGLHEMHQVKESLSGKLKCLIFMPIVSHTYCDPASYAWNNEFLVYKKLTETDSFGLKVKLHNGNVASRIIPIRIHDLDSQDRTLLESELGGVLRSIDFIFRSTGVNRPLRAHEDHPQDNQNKTYYRDQINKVANLTKEIILALKQPHVDRHGNFPPTKTPTTRALTKGKKGVGLSLLLILLTLSLIYYFQKSESNYYSTPADTRTAIAVIPLSVIGDPKEGQYLADGMTDVIRSNLSLFPELKVKSRTSVERYRASQKTIPEIARELDVLFILEGSAQKSGNDIRVVVQLIDARTDVNIWSQQYDKKFENIFEIQNQISESIAQSLKAAFTPDIIDRIRRIPTADFETYDLFLRAKQASSLYEKSGEEIYLNQAIHLLNLSLKKDSRFALGYAWLAGLKTLKGTGSASDKTQRDSSFLLAHRALELDSTVTEGYLVLSELYQLIHDDVHALRFTYDALKMDWMDSTSTLRLIKRLGAIYSRLGEADEALYFFNEMLKTNPVDIDALYELFYVQAAAHEVDKLMTLLQRVEKISPDDDLVSIIQTHIALERREYAQMQVTLQLRQSHPSYPAAGYDSYDLMYAYLLKKSGKENEASRLAKEIRNQWGKDDAYLTAQLQAFDGDYKNALQSLAAEEVGWYTLNLCTVNPLFENVSSDPQFKKFLERNQETISDKRDRVRQLENQGYLQRPMQYAKGKVSRKLSSP